jgi:hypothetical protein
MAPQDELRVHLRTATLVGVTIIASLVLYLGVVEVIRAKFKPFSGFVAIESVQQVRFLFYALAIVAVLLIRFLRMPLLKRSPQDDRKAGLHKLQRASMITLVLAELPGILGLVLFLLTGRNIDFYLLLFVSLFLIFMYFPRFSGWEEWLKG